MDPIKRVSSGGQPDILSSKASWLLYSTEWSDDEEEEGVERSDANEDACSVFSEASLHKEVNRVLQKSSSSDSLESWEDENIPWTKLSQESESWDAMVDSQGIILSQDGLTVLKNTLKQSKPVKIVTKMYSQSEEDVSSEDTGSEWGFLGSSQVSTPRNEYSFFTEVEESTDMGTDESKGNATVSNSSAVTVDTVVDKERTGTNDAAFEQLSDQVSALIMEQKSLRENFNEDRQRLFQVVVFQSKKIRSLEKKRSEDRKKYSSLVKSMQHRNQYLEGLMVDLARECAGLADQLVGVKQDIQQKQLDYEVSSPNKESRSRSLSAISPEEDKRTPLSKRLSSSIVSQQRVGKLKKFFGNEPPLLEMLLKRLGYEQYLSKFQREKITILELPHITEEQLIQMGIPLGPRQRILSEIQKL